jgi:N-acetylglutamate synthase-like GNAT family acetyltransferase
LQLSDCQFIELETVKLPLVNQFYKRVYKKGLARKGDAVFILKQKAIICSAKLKKLGNQQLLTGVACDPQYRGQGFASQLIKNILLLQQQPIYCFPYAHLQSFYSQLGFVLIDSQTTPEIISQKFYAYSKNRALILMIFSN